MTRPIMLARRAQISMTTLSWWNGLLACVSTVFRLVLVGLLGLPLAACTGTTAPALRIVDASVLERSPEAAVVVFTLEATNPNSEALPLTRVEYELSVGGKVLAQGLRAAEATIRRHGHSNITLPVSIPLAPGAAQGTIPYRLVGRVGYLPFNATSRMLVDAGLRYPSAGFADEGTIAFPDASLSGP